jgi:hypothetical protein
MREVLAEDDLGLRGALEVMQLLFQFLNINKTPRINISLSANLHKLNHFFRLK